MLPGIHFFQEKVNEFEFPYLQDLQRIPVKLDIFAKFGLINPGHAALLSGMMWNIPRVT